MTLREIEYESAELGTHRRIVKVGAPNEAGYGHHKIIRQFEAESFQEFCRANCSNGTPRKLEAWNQKDLGALLAVSDGFVYSILLTEPVRLIVPGRHTDNSAEFLLVDKPWDPENPRVYVAD